jgi:hypothetical protein
MKPSMPPPAATWLLRRFGSGRGIEFLIGDLMEGYAHGRSVGWYWRQVLFAIVIGFFHEVRGHKLLTIRAIVTGWAVWLFLCVLLRNPPAVGDGVQSVLAQVLPANWWIHSFYPFALITCLVSATSGWVVARLHRPHQVAMVLVFVASVLLCRFPWLITLAVDSLDNARYLHSLSGEFDWIFLTVTSIFVGGLLGAPPVPAAPLATEQNVT